MTHLKQVEHAFQDYLLNGTSAIFQSVVGTNKVPALQRLGIYEQAYRSRLHEALMASYPILHTYLGDDDFQTLCYDYINSHPSSFRSVRWFGDQLAHFIQSHADYKEYPYVAELAQFEWTLALAFDAKDSPVIALEDMQSIPPEAWSTMCFKTHPSIHCLSLQWNVAPMWQAMTEEQTPPEPETSDVAVSWLIWRQQFSSQFSSISPDEAFAIDAMIKGDNFGDICEGLCQWIEEEHVGMHAASLLKGWISAGLITEIVIK